LAHRVVALDDKRGEQLVPAGEVAVHGRRHDTEIARDGPQREIGTVDGEVLAGDLLDLFDGVGAGPGPRRTGPVGHAAQCATKARAVLWDPSRKRLRIETGRREGGTRRPVHARGYKMAEQTTVGSAAVLSRSAAPRCGCASARRSTGRTPPAV